MACAILWYASSPGRTTLTKEAQAQVSSPATHAAGRRAVTNRVDGHSRHGTAGSGSVDPEAKFNRLTRTIRAYSPTAGVELIERAYRRAVAAHEGQVRDSGEPYVNHCIETAIILAEFHLESAPIAA